MDTHDSRTEQWEPTTRQSSSSESVSNRDPLLAAEFKQRLDLIRHVAANSDRIPLVRGVHGVGKSTLVGLLQQQASADWEICRIDATTMLQQEQLIYRLCRHFSTPQVSLDGVDQLIVRLVDLKQMGRLPVIIVDDAEQLPISSLVELFALHTGTSNQAGGVALILFAAPQIDDLLEMVRPQIASQQLQVLELFPLDREQSDQLVRHLFKLLGGAQERSISKAEYERIFRTSNGLPGKINQQVEQMLQPTTKTPAAVSKKQFTLPGLLADVSAPVLIGGGILTLLLLLTLIYEKEINAVFQADQASSGEVDGEVVGNTDVMPLTLTLPEQPLKVERFESTQMEDDGTAVASPRIIDEPVQSLADEPDLSPGPSQVEHSDVAPAVIAIDLPELTAEQPADKSSESQASEQPQANPMAPTSTTALEAGKPVEKVETGTALNGQPTTVEESVTTEAEAAKRVSPKLDSALGEPPNTAVKVGPRTGSPAPITELGKEQRPNKKTVPKPITLTTKSKKVSPAPVQEDGIRQEEWLLKQSPGSYTLQLIGVGDEQAIPSFIKRYQLQGDAAYFRTKRNGRPWFPVLYGVYPNRSAAVAAASKLPAGLAGRGAWPRSLASVQQAIKGG